MCLNTNNVRTDSHILGRIAILQYLARCAHPYYAREPLPQNCARRDLPPCSQVSLPQNCARSPTPLRSVMHKCRASTRGFLATERGRSKDRTSAGHKVCPREVRTRLLSEHVRGFATSERSRQKAEARAGLHLCISGAGGWGCARFLRL